jgi:hypothetical protein
MAARDLSLLIKLKDDTKQNSNEAIGLATYSNYKSRVIIRFHFLDTLIVIKQFNVKIEIISTFFLKR